MERCVSRQIAASHLSWKYYAPALRYIGGQVWSEFDSVRSVRYGPDWKNVISPYARIARGRRAGCVSQTQYEFGSVLKFVEETFNLPPVGPASRGFTDTRAASLMDVFDFTQQPRPFAAMPAKYPASHFLHERPSLVPPDDD